MLAPERIQHRQARTAFDHVVLGVDLEPQPGRRTGQHLVEILGLEAQSGGWPHEGGDRRQRQDLISASEPMPFGVLIVVQVPFGTFFHELPW